jgi:hypothetical protein
MRSIQRRSFGAELHLRRSGQNGTSIVAAACRFAPVCRSREFRRSFRQQQTESEAQGDVFLLSEAVMADEALPVDENR